MQVNGDSVEFQNNSQISLALSQKQDDDSRDYKQDLGGKYLRFQDERKREERLSSPSDREAVAVQQKLEVSALEISKLQGVVKGLEGKLKSKEAQIDELEKDVVELQEAL